MPNGISIASTVLPQYTLVTKRQTDRQRKRQCKSRVQKQPITPRRWRTNYNVCVYGIASRDIQCEWIRVWRSRDVKWFWWRTRWSRRHTNILHTSSSARRVISQAMLLVGLATASLRPAVQYTQWWRTLTTTAWQRSFWTNALQYLRMSTQAEIFGQTFKYRAS